MRWILTGTPRLTVVYPRFTGGSSIRLAGEGPDLAYAAPVVTLNVGARTVGAWLPGGGKQAWGLDQLYGGMRFDPLDNGYAPQVRAGQLVVWLLRWPGDGGSPRDLCVLETGWYVVP